MTIGGLKVVTSLYYTEPKQMRVSIPCGRSGWTKHVLRTVQVPRADATRMGDTIIIHPALLPELRRLAS